MMVQCKPCDVENYEDMKMEEDDSGNYSNDNGNGNKFT